MSARRWPTAAPERAVEGEAPPVLLVPEVSLEEAEAAEREARNGLSVARAERDEAREALAGFRASLPEAAVRGLEAARAAQAKIGKAADRLEAAEALYAAMEAAHRPLHATASELRRRQLGEAAVAALLGKLAERDAVDVELDAAFGKLAEVALRRIAVDREALALHETASQYGRGSVGREVSRPLWASLKSSIRALPDNLRHAFTANL